MHRIAHVHPLEKAGDGAPADAAPERVLAGSGFARAWNAFTDASGRFHAGLWTHGPGVLAVDYTETELCVILEGRVRLASDAGTSSTTRATPSSSPRASAAPGNRSAASAKAYAILEPLGRGAHLDHPELAQELAPHRPLEVVVVLRRLDEGALALDHELLVVAPERRDVRADRPAR